MDDILLYIFEDDDVEVSVASDDTGKEYLCIKANGRGITLSPETWHRLALMFTARPTTTVEDLIELGDMLRHRIAKHGVA